MHLNTNIPGNKFHHTSSNSATGGVGVYVKSNLTVDNRDDLSFCDNEFETIWSGIDNPKAKIIFNAALHIFTLIPIQQDFVIICMGSYLTLKMKISTSV